MELPPRLNDLFLVWIGELYEKSIQDGSQVASTYKRAIESLTNCPKSFEHPQQLLELKYFGPGLCGKLTKKLQSYCTANGLQFVSTPQKEQPVARSNSKTSKRPTKDTNDSPVAPKKKQCKRVYIPRYRSGAYAILLALFHNDTKGSGLSKAELIRHATPYSETGFAAPTTTQHYSAWNSSKTLISNGLIYASGRPVYYYITDEGKSIARKLIEAEAGLQSAQTPIISQKSPTPQSQPQPEVGRIAVPNKTVGQQKYNSAPRESTDFRSSDNLWPPGSYDIILIIDNREIRSTTDRQYITEQLELMSVRNEVRSLSLGDCLWIARNKQTKEEVVLDYIVERKRLDDLISSIKDGRYEEQKARLKRSGITNVIYLVEDLASTNKGGMVDAIQTSMSLVLMVNDFYLRRCSSLNDSIRFLISTTKQVCDFYEHRSLRVLRIREVEHNLALSELLQAEKTRTQTPDVCLTFSTFQEILSKRGMLTIKEIYLRMLMTIRGVSFEKALAIQKRFATPKALLEAYINTPTDQAKRTLVFDHLGSAASTKKIGKALSEVIYTVWGK